MNCDYEGCQKTGCACTSVWLLSGGMLVKYWCKEHAPADAEFFCHVKAMTGGRCDECDIAAPVDTGAG